MKKALISILIASAVFCTGCSAQNAEHVPANEEIRAELFLNNLPTDENGDPVYPDSYAGDFFGLYKWFFKITDIDCVSEYQYLKDAYPDIEFQEAKYSYNYLQSLLDEYEASGEMRPGERLYIDRSENRAVVEVDEDILSEKQFDKDSPLIFKPIGPIMIPCSD